MSKSIEGKAITIFTGLSIEEANKHLTGLQDKYEKTKDGYKCKKCGNGIQQTTAYISVHQKGWSTCGGTGKVQNVNFPYCPMCNGKPSMVRGCIHV